MTPRRVKGVDPKLLWAAAARVSQRLQAAGIPHALIGGLAVGHYGYEHATKDVDFLVAEESLRQLTGRPLATGLTEQENGIEIDYVNVAGEMDEETLEKLIVSAKPDSPSRIPIVTMNGLILLKLIAGRMKDKAAVVELIKRGAVNVRAVREFLSMHATNDNIADFELCLLEAGLEAP